MCALRVCVCVFGFHLVYTTGLRVLLSRCHDEDKLVEIYTTPLNAEAELGSFLFVPDSERERERERDEAHDLLFNVITCRGAGDPCRARSIQTVGQAHKERIKLE